MKIMIIILATLLIATTSISYGEGDILGIWKTENEESRIEIYPCGEKLCGKIVWLKEPTYTQSSEGSVGTPIIDRNNPDPAMRRRAIMGLQVMEGFIEQGESTWGKGTIYDPESGNTYRCKIHLLAPNRLEVRGFIGIQIFGRTSVWVR